MNIELLGAFVGFAFVMTFTPGPNNLMVMASGAAFGWRRTVPHMAGIATGFAAMVGAFVLGLGAVLQQVPELLAAVRWLGTAWLLWMAWRLAAPAFRPAPEASVAEAGASARPMRMYEAVLFQWVNPKALTVAAAAAAAYAGLAPEPAIRAMTMAGVFMVMAPVSNGCWVVAGEGLRKLTGGSAGARAFSLLMAALVAASAALIVFG